MNQIRLTDIDELTFLVRDKNSRSHIIEAIAAYRGGANRASIISTWIAVTSDIISKIRELAFQGDPGANNIITDLDNAISAKNLKRLQEIENKLLDKAKIDFEFISPQEHIDLGNLKLDRHLCAHPAFVDNDSLFQPTPERVRLHIVHAIVYLLQHPPTQGRTAIDRIKQDMMQPSYPSDQEGVNRYLNAQYLNHAKEALITNLVKVLLTNLLRMDEPALRNKERVIIHTLVAISVKHSALFENTLSSKLPTLASSLTDEELCNIFRLINADGRIRKWAGEPTQLRVKELVKKLRTPELIQHAVFSAITIEEMKQHLFDRFDALSRNDQIDIIASSPQREFCDRAITLYCDTQDFREAENIGINLILRMTGLFSTGQIVKIIEGAGWHNYIKHANGTPKIMEDFFELTKPHLIQSEVKDAWKELVEMDSSRSPVYSSIRSKLIANNVIPAGRS